MNEKRIYLSPPHMSGMENSYIEEAFKDNWVSPIGPNITAFEEAMAKFIGVKGGVALNSGTASLHLALRAAGVGPGDTVFCSSLTFIASANPIIYLGATPVFIDSEPNSWNISPIALKRALEFADKEGTLPKALVVVNIYGQCADYEEIRCLSDRYGIQIIEDAAESLGATYLGNASGSLGDIGILSFNGNKMITTSGGGMLLSNDVDVLNKARFWSTQAKEPVAYYEHKELGYNYRLSNILAGIGRGQLSVLPQRVEARRKVFDRYVEGLSGIQGIEFMPEMKKGYSSRWLTVMTIDNSHSKTVTQLIQELSRHNIESRQVWKPLHMQPVFKHTAFYPHSENQDIAKSLFYKGICLPSGSNLTVEEQQRIINAIRSFLK
jgi:pyridoxal phosphate-dependent aminotransferase EpsN